MKKEINKIESPQEKPERKIVICPYCGAEINQELMSTEAYYRHYDGTCQDIKKYGDD